ncbi:hypothetical protein Tcan_04015 [Toxocara canis]|uniref:Uncharacterized protein n=1 Tax=Toxocara canis TaxID=6265 RepID=A0A0B2V139_TOXCA|nr:hypothetical protein Tcan_04015 [Toxocara canis]
MVETESRSPESGFGKETSVAGYSPWVIYCLHEEAVEVNYNSCYDQKGNFIGTIEWTQHNFSKRIDGFFFGTSPDSGKYGGLSLAEMTLYIQCNVDRTQIDLDDSLQHLTS